LGTKWKKYLDDLIFIGPVVADGVIDSARELVTRAGLVGDAAEADPFEPGFYIRTQRSIDNIKFLISTCAVEKNPTKAGEVKNILKI
jgi:hypothetical protein